MASLISDIKGGSIAPVYLFYGEEAFKKRHFKETLKTAVTGGNMMNYAAFEGRDIDWKAVYDAVVTLPFFAPKRLVVVENSGKFKAGKNDEDANAGTEEKSSAMLERILQELPATTCLAFFEESAAKNKKLYKTIAAKGVVCECGEDTQEQLLNWLARGFSREGKKIRRSTLELMIARCGTEYDQLRTEYEKVISFAGEREVIEDGDILAVTSETTESRIFDMLSAICEQNIRKVLDKYHDLLANREHPLYILAMLRSQFRTMLQVAELTEEGLSAQAVAREVGRPGFVVNNMRRNLRYFSREQLEKILYEIADTDLKCKTGLLQDQIGVEMLLLRFSGKDPAFSKTG